MKHGIYNLIATLTDYALNKKLIEKEDEIYARNRIMALLKLDGYEEGEILHVSFSDVIEGIDDYAVEKGIIANDTVTERDIFDTEIMTVFCDKPSAVTEKFYKLYGEDKIKATDFFYNYSIDTNYIRKYRVDRDMKWSRKNAKYGRMDITVNLSKPEKDPKEIERQKNMPKSNYPICLLCRENEGYKGRLNHPARGNIRLIPMTLGGENFFMQYSPYSYYNEHCILLSAEHKPMVINTAAIQKLLDFVEILPHYFAGSNADLPIVGGSILAHEHFQGGRYRFPMQDAKTVYSFDLPVEDGASGKKVVGGKIIRWPLSVIRLASDSKTALIKAFDKVMNRWVNYSDEEAGIIAYTDDVRHNTVTPIARINDDGKFELDLVLRNNLTTEEYPLGVFHPHDEYHHIKKENIGLIEVMGLAVLPARLKTELKELGECLYKGEDITGHKDLEKHIPWAEEMKKKYTFTEDNYMEILKDEVADIFAKLLENSGVFKQTQKGIGQFIRFIDGVVNR